MGVAIVEKSKVDGTDRDKRREKLLKLLTYEVVDGKPIYYRGYKEVIAGKKQPEEVMGSSTKQAVFVANLLIALRSLLDKGYILTTNEHGLKIDGGRRALDIGIFKADALDIKDEYADVPPVVAIEVDTKAELEGGSFIEYMKRKIEDLLRFGVKRVIWILTKAKVVVIAEDPKNWKVLDWDDEFEVWEGVRLRLSDLLERPQK